MNLSPELVGLVRALLLNRGVAALATLHDGLPSASMVPFAATAATGRFVLLVHVSGMAAHTRDMQSRPEVCLLVTTPESADVPPQALPRISIPAVESHSHTMPSIARRSISTPGGRMLQPRPPATLSPRPSRLSPPVMGCPFTGARGERRKVLT
jgi:hypothetical protein